MEKHEKYLSPAQFAEIEIIKSILSGKFEIGQALMPERELAVSLGITRPTLREALQRLSSDGWISIKHGRPTIVNDYENKGGLSVLKQLTHFSEFATQKLIIDWLEFRVLIFPSLAQKAIDSNPDEVSRFLENRPDEKNTVSDFSKFDWELQLLLIKISGNSIAKMLYNDLSENYLKQAEVYFSTATGRKMSVSYYEKLRECIIIDRSLCGSIVNFAMEESLKHWLICKNSF